MCIIILIIVSSSVSAIGIGPVFTNIDFEPNLAKTYQFSIYNNDHLNFNAALSVTGELKDYITLETNNTLFKSNEESKKIIFSVKLPRNIPPGEYKSKIVIKEFFNTTSMIGAVAAVSHKLTLRVPKHGKYIKFSIEKVDKKLFTTIQNIGLKKIENIQVISTIYDKIKSTEYSKSIKDFMPDQTFNFSISLNQTPGIYSHNTIIRYDELIKNVTDTITIGKLVVLINNLTIQDFKLGEINQLNIPVLTTWNQPIKNITVEVEVLKNNELITTINSPTITLNKNLTAKVFLDTKNYVEGEYQFVVKALQNKDVISQKAFSLMLKTKSIVVQTKISLTLIIVSISVLVLAIIVLLFEKKKIRKNIEKKRKKL